MSAPGKLLLAPIAAAFLVAGCAARVGVDGASFEKTEFSVYLDRGRRTGRSYDVLMTESAALRVDDEKIIRHRPYVIPVIRSEDVPTDINALITAWHAGFVVPEIFESVSRLMARADELDENDQDSIKEYLLEVPLEYVRVRPGVIRVAAIYAAPNQGILINRDADLIFTPPIPDTSGVYTSVSLDDRFYAYAYCSRSREEDDNRQCEMKIYEAGSPVALREEVFAGYVEDLAFSCDGTALYLLWKQIDIKQGPIDSLFAVAGHPNSDDDYLLSRYPLQGAAQVSTVKVARSDAGSSGTLVSTCPDGQTAQSR